MTSLLDGVPDARLHGRSDSFVRGYYAQKVLKDTGNNIYFGIVTAIEIERLTVCKAFKLTDKVRVPRGARQYWRGCLLLDNHDCYEIVVTQLPDMANVDSASASNDMIHHWKPGAILMVGIAAAATEEQGLGMLQ